MHDNDKKSLDGQQEYRVQLPDASVGETNTDVPQLQLELELELEEAVRVEPRYVTFDLPSSSWQQRQQLAEARDLVEEMIDKLLPASEKDTNESEGSMLEQATSATTTTTTTGAASCTNDERLQRILQLLDRYTRNLEEHVLSVNRAELQLTQNCEMGTQAQTTNSLRLGVTSTIRPKPNLRLNQQQQQASQQQQPQQAQSELQPPCERRYHTITISANTTSNYAPRPRPTTIMGRIGHAMGDFAGAFCLCLQVNKDCVFCLGFFIAFVISASFLTAFFYRTINLTQTPVRAPLETAGPQPANEVVTVRFNGGYYYIYNNPRQHFL